MALYTGCLSSRRPSQRLPAATDRTNYGRRWWWMNSIGSGGCATRISNPSLPHWTKVEAFTGLEDGYMRKGESSGAQQSHLHRNGLRPRHPPIQSQAVRTRLLSLGHEKLLGYPIGDTDLFSLIQTRRSESPEGSYTRRLFEDEALLRSKLVEADELLQAETPRRPFGRWPTCLLRPRKAGQSRRHLVRGRG